MAVEIIYCNLRESKTIVFEREPHLTLSPNRKILGDRCVGNRVFKPKKRCLEVYYIDENPTDMELLIAPEMSITVDGKIYRDVSSIQFQGNRMFISYSTSDTVPTDVNDLYSRVVGEIELEIEKAELEKEKKKLEKENAELAKEKKELQDRSAENSGAEKDLQNEIEKLKAALDLKNNRQAEDDLKKSIEKLTKDKNNLEKEIINRTQEVEQLQKDLQECTDNNQTLEGKIRGTTTLIENAKTEKEKLEAEHTVLNNEYTQKYDISILNKMRIDNDRLKEKLENARKKFFELSGEKEAYQSLLNKQAEDNREIRQKIDAQPQELKDLQAEYERLTTKLQQTINAIQECSEEKQEELRNQIAEHEPTATKLQEEYDAIETQYVELKARISDLEQKKGQDLLNLWPIITDTVNTLKENVGTMSSELDALEKEVNTFNASVETCGNKLEKLKSWYMVDRSPLQKFLERVGQTDDSEYSTIHRTFNIENIDRVSRILTETDSNLSELDRILHDLIESSISDDKTIQDRTETGMSLQR